MKLRFILVVLYIGITFKQARAQNSPLSLKPGKAVPDITFEIMNNDKKPISLSALKGKLVILDFWSTGCISCIKKFPLLDSLQAMFGDKIKIILVNPKRYGDDENKVNRIFDIYKKNNGKTLQLSSTINDTTAVKYFPHSAQSHFAWIDQQGVVKAISGYVKKEDIEQILAGKTPEIIQKNDFVIDEHNESLFAANSTGIKFKSMFTGYLDLSRAFRKQHLAPFGTAKVPGARFINEPLYRILFHAHLYFPKQNRVLFEGLNPADFIRYDKAVPDAIWARQHQMCYELIAPGMSKEEAMEQCKADIAARFHIRAAAEQRKIPCWVIKMDEQQMQRIKQKNKNMKSLPHSLSSFTEYYFSNLDMPVIVETKFDQKVFPEFENDFKFKAANGTDIKEFAKNNGLTLSQEERMLEVFVIKNIANKNK